MATSLVPGAARACCRMQSRARWPQSKCMYAFLYTHGHIFTYKIRALTWAKASFKLGSISVSFRILAARLLKKGCEMICPVGESFSNSAFTTKVYLNWWLNNSSVNKLLTSVETSLKAEVRSFAPDTFALKHFNRKSGTRLCRTNAFFLGGNSIEPEALLFRSIVNDCIENGGCVFIETEGRTIRFYKLLRRRKNLRQKRMRMRNRGWEGWTLDNRNNSSIFDEQTALRQRLSLGRKDRTWLLTCQSMTTWKLRHWTSVATVLPAFVCKTHSGTA